MARGFPPEFKRDQMMVARRSTATVEELAPDFGFSVNSLRRWMKQADVAEGLAAGPSDASPDVVVALRRRLWLREQENEVLRCAVAYVSRDVVLKGCSRWSPSVLGKGSRSRCRAVCWGSHARRTTGSSPILCASGTGMVRI